MKGLTLAGFVLFLICFVEFTGADPVGTCPSAKDEVDNFLPDDKHCHHYWHCEDGTPVRMVCTKSYYFDYEKNVCMDRELALCYSVSIGNGEGEDDNDPECPMEDGEYVTHIPHEDCTKFWKCDKGVAVEQECPEGLQFNPILLLCDYPEQAGCEGEGGIPTEGTTPDDPKPTDPTTEGTTAGDGGEERPDCPAEDGEYVTHFPHKDCTKFWKCDKGVAVEQDCPEGLQFNPILSLCDYPEQAGCEGEGGIPTEGTTPDDPKPTDPTTEGTTAGDGGEERPDCPAEDGEYVTHFPHKDCTKFWKCDKGVAVEQDCPEGLQFNPILSLCDYPEQAGCEGEGGIPTEGTTPGEEIPTTAPIPGYGHCETLSCPPLNAEYPYYLPVPDDCTRFCECDWGVPYEFICPGGLYFNPEKNVCDYKQNVNCQM